jgi:hypothetical protein
MSPHRAAVKNAETLGLSRSITDPDARRMGPRYGLPDIAVDIDSAGHTASALVTPISGFLGEDVGTWVRGGNAEELMRAIRADDERLHAGPVPRDFLRRCRVLITTDGRAELSRAGVTSLLKACSGESVALSR